MEDCPIRKKVELFRHSYKIDSEMSRFFVRWKRSKYRNKKDIFRVLNNIVVTLPEMIKLAKIYGSNGITALMLNIPLPERRNNVRNIEATPNPIMKSQSVTVDSCGATIRTSKRSNCGDEINSFGKSSCGDENRTFGRSRC